jgi:post-segregation antitoxin (ccd killing protein)
MRKHQFPLSKGDTLMARRKTKQIPRYNTVINLRVDQTLHQEAHDLCKILDLPVSHLARTALREFINRNRSRKALFEVSPT